METMVNENVVNTVEQVSETVAKKAPFIKKETMIGAAGFAVGVAAVVVATTAVKKGGEFIKSKKEKKDQKVIEAKTEPAVTTEEK